MPKDVWILDPGVTIHMIFQSEVFSPSRIDYITYVDGSCTSVVVFRNIKFQPYFN